MGFLSAGKRPSNDFREASSFQYLNEDHFSQFTGDRELSINLVAKQALDLPWWLRMFPGKNPVHLYIEIKDDQNNIVAELHGLPFKRETNMFEDVTGWYDDELRMVISPGLPRSASNPEMKRFELYKGSGTEVAARLANALYQGQSINNDRHNYIPYILGMQGQNSNTVARMMINAMGLEDDRPEEITGKWWRQADVWAPGYNKGMFNEMRTVSPVFRPEDGLSTIFASINRMIPDMRREAVANQVYVEAQQEKGRTAVAALPGLTTART